jgi:DHA2 family multidrug resistance protein
MGRALLDAIVTQQAMMIAYLNDYKLLMALTLATVPLVLLIRTSRRKLSEQDLEDSVVVD